MTHADADTQDDYNNSPCGLSLATCTGGSFPHLQFKPCPAPATP
jgi:hypothetical protein